MIFYAIRNKVTGFFLPQLNRRRGFTHTEPAQMQCVPPRLFLTAPQAKLALDWWLLGRCYDDGEGALNIASVSSRKRENMEIVTINLALLDVTPPLKEKSKWFIKTNKLGKLGPFKTCREAETVTRDLVSIATCEIE